MLELFNSLKADYFAFGLSAEKVNLDQVHSIYSALYDTFSLLDYSEDADFCDLPQNARIVITDYFDRYNRHSITILNYQTPWGKHEHIFAIPDGAGNLQVQRYFVEV